MILDPFYWLMGAGIMVAILMGGMTLYPLLQAFGVIECNCGKSPEDKWTCIDS